MLILHGKDRFRQDEHLQSLRRSRRNTAMAAPTPPVSTASSAKIVADILDECRSFGLMQQHKIVLVDNAELLVKASDEEEVCFSTGEGRRQTRPRPRLRPRDARELRRRSIRIRHARKLRASTRRPGNLDKAVAMSARSSSASRFDLEAIAWAQPRQGIAPDRHQPAGGARSGRGRRPRVWPHRHGAGKTALGRWRRSPDHRRTRRADGRRYPAGRVLGQTKTG